MEFRLRSRERFRTPLLNHRYFISKCEQHSALSAFADDNDSMCRIPVRLTAIWTIELLMIMIQCIVYQWGSLPYELLNSLSPVNHSTMITLSVGFIYDVYIVYTWRQNEQTNNIEATILCIIAFTSQSTHTCHNFVFYLLPEVSGIWCREQYIFVQWTIIDSTVMVRFLV